MYKFLVQDERGAVTVDWVALTAGIMVLGVMVVYAIMNDSADHLLDEFDSLNNQYSETATQVVQAVQQSAPGQ